MTLDEFIKRYDDTYLEFDGAFKYQCQDLAKAWEAENGWPIIRGNANQVINNAPKDFYEVVDKPQRGDLVVWNIGDYGHIAVFVEPTADGFISFDQNYPVGTPCHLQKHTYKNILGYLRPKGETMTEEQKHREAVEWAFRSIYMKEPTKAKIDYIIAQPDGGDIMKVRQAMIDEVCAGKLVEQEKQLTAKCQNQLLEQAAKLNADCQKRVNEAIEIGQKSVVCPDIDKLGAGELIAMGLRKWLGIK